MNNSNKNPACSSIYLAAGVFKRVLLWIGMAENIPNLMGSLFITERNSNENLIDNEASTWELHESPRTETPVQLIDGYYSAKALIDGHEDPMATIPAQFSDGQEKIHSSWNLTCPGEEYLRKKENVNFVQETVQIILKSKKSFTMFIFRCQMPYHAYPGVIWLF